MSKFFLIALVFAATVCGLASADTTGCGDGYNWVEGVCVPFCSAANCLVCSPEDATGATCAQCRSGYAMTSPGKCTATCNIANCALCNSGGANKCTSCNTGYMVEAHGKCVAMRKPSGASAASSSLVAVGAVAAALGVMSL